MRRTDGPDRVVRYLERWIRIAGPDSPLPPVRQMSRDCGVSPTTLTAILRDFQSTNRLVVRSRKGIYTPPLLEV